MLIYMQKNGAAVVFSLGKGRVGLHVGHIWTHITHNSSTGYDEGPPKLEKSALETLYQGPF